MGRIYFGLTVLRKRLERQLRSCPFCGNPNTVFLDRKHLILELRRCPSCFLKFRWPKDSPADNALFYQNAYQEGAVTSLPGHEEIARLCASNFRGSPMDFQDRIEILRKWLPRGKVLDYGASWGYGLHQLIQAGYEAVGWEISRPRAEFGKRKLRVAIESDWPEVERLAPYDGVVSSHVLEHVPDPRVALERFSRIVHPGGWVLILVPNAAGKSAREMGARWGALIGEKHSLALDAAFFAKNLPSFGFEEYSFASRPLCSARTDLAWEVTPHSGALEEDELLLAARKTSCDPKGKPISGSPRCAP